jgi:catechol 2,3-dioxygenase-like lactoylglutathione lyase family enzyme
MLTDQPAIATVAVKDLAQAKPFYQDKLGLKFVSENPQVLTFEAGGHLLFVYKSGFAGTNQATSVTWRLDDVEAVAVDLKSRGVTFEDYGDLPQLHREGDVYKGHGMTVCWFKDPDGNIISLVSRS